MSTMRDMYGEKSGGSPPRGVLTRLLVLVAGLIAFVAVPAGVASATADQEEYPPDAIVNLLDPFGCDPASISGEIGAVLAGSTVNLSLTINGAAASEIAQAAGADGQLEYTLPVPPNRYGPAVVTASGTDSVGDPFTLETSGTITACPAEIPKTGNSGTGTWLTFGAGAVLAGGLMLAMSGRRRRTMGAPA